jgi:hypothetical protein
LNSASAASINLRGNLKTAAFNKSQSGHGHHLLRAEKDLAAALAAISAQNLKQAHKDVASAIHQVEEAIHHHHKHHISTQGQTNGKTKHHHHHDLLHRVVAELRVAEKELHAGASGPATKEIQKAEKSLKQAISSHNQLFQKH